jgi:hypothetical protein
LKETPFFSAIGHQARITDEVSVFAGELAAIRLAFEYVSQLSKASGQARFTIFSDSLSAIKTVQKGHCTSRPKLFHQLLEVISKSNAKTTLVWVPSHIGIHGNEQADRLANAAIQSSSVELEIGIEDSDELPEVDRFVFRKWQEEWEKQPAAVSYRRLEPVVGRRERFRFGSRTAETMAHRLRFGKCAVNAVLHVMRKHDTGLCDRCAVPETVQHYLLECSSDLAAGVKQLCVTYKFKVTAHARCSIRRRGDTAIYRQNGRSSSVASDLTKTSCEEAPRQA